ncbi:helix-turn-helix transcriptional regulator [Streptomyces sp. CRN 30]|uniref:helix-turn-helix domain-containing protein n=1 Tax=Streptomyces sp. CRN 30 TaxID=3075613 RepID=UPI002A81368A|nr:helix-turn-helix transcriptional regulator [Streptomyces sp. CRN 30]
MATSQPMMGNSTSSVLGRRLGGELLRLRTTAGLTQTDAAKALSSSLTKVTKMERGWVPVRDPDIRALCELYGVRESGDVALLLELAKADRERRKAKGWWDNYSTLGDMHEYAALESGATAVKAWQPAFVPGLLQTPDYMRSLRTGLTVTTPQEDEEFLAARLARQRRLDNGTSFTLRTVMYEAVLHNLPGGIDIARGQIDHLVQMAERPNITLLVYPFSAGPHTGLNGSFNVISFAEPGAMDIVYVEIPYTRLWIEGGPRAAAHDALFEALAARSHSERDSVSLLRRLHKDL